LIGAELVAGLRDQPAGPVTLVGTPGLCRRFSLALARADRACTVIDGDAAFVAGAHAIWRAAGAQAPQQGIIA
jgi:2-keto-3-deoxy-galactonokinase